MEFLEKNKENLCSFYVSDWHLATMMLPYINKEIDENSNIITFIQESIEENVKTLIFKLNLKNEREILKIDWNNYIRDKKGILEKKLESIKDKTNKNNTILISGSKEYIDLINKDINKWMNKNTQKIKDKKFKIIDSYEVGEFNNSINEILDNHSKIVNTSGEKDVSEVFEGYSKMKEIS